VISLHREAENCAFEDFEGFPLFFQLSRADENEKESVEV